MNIYETEKFYVIWKPNGISTTMGGQHNFIEILTNHKDKSQIISSLYNLYSDIYIDKPNELGLVNRLDNGTGGCLWFAKTEQIYQAYKQNQKNNTIDKIYIANVYGKQEDAAVDCAIGHHYSDSARMTTDASIAKKMTACQTNIKLLKYHEIEDISTIEVTINQGIRHQIRVHLASIGKYIVGENIYTTKGFRKKLSEDKLRQEENLQKYIFSENEWFEANKGKLSIIENNDIYLDNYLYNRDILTYHLWSIGVKNN